MSLGTLSTARGDASGQFVEMRSDRGQALIETILLGLLFLAPLIWSLGVLADLHRGALAASAAARAAGFDAARAIASSDAQRAGTEAFRQAFIDHGIDPAGASLRFINDRGFRRGRAIELEVVYPVSVLQAPLLGKVSGPSIVVRARHTARIDPFRSR